MTLTPLGDNRSVLTLKDGTQILFSYKTPVAAFIPSTGYRRTARHWSKTTQKHIGQWLEGVHAPEEEQAFFDTLAESK